MPLEVGGGKAAFSHNVKAEVAAGKPQKQAVAIAYSEQGHDTALSEVHLVGRPQSVVDLVRTADKLRKR